MPPTPESLARKNNDDQLTAAGWTVQDRGVMNLYAARGVAVREFLLEKGIEGGGEAEAGGAAVRV
jgi:type I restriction enzyme R subunit